MLLLDTHAAIWFATEDDSLDRRSRHLAVAALKDGRLSLSAVSFWEIALLVAKGRLRSIAHRATLATADERLLKWKHPLKRQDARR